jgi:hypothetical protein
MKTVSVSEIQTWRDCKQRWEYAFVYEKDNPTRGIPLASGTAVHETIKAILTGEINKGYILNYAEHMLRQELFQRDDVEKQVSKYLPGVERALRWVPEWVWEIDDWVVEVPHTTVFSEDTAETQGMSLRYTPDIYRVHTEEVETWDNKKIKTQFVDVYDFKTGKKDALEYYLTSPQLDYYAVCLSKLYPDAIIRKAYVSLPTGANIKPLDLDLWVLTDSQLEEAERELVEGIQDVGVGRISPRRGTHCTWCDFSNVTITRFTGGDWKQVLEEEYVLNEYVRKLRKAQVNV